MAQRSGVDNTARRKWDRNEFEQKAAEREQAEKEKLEAKRKPAGEIVPRELLKPHEESIKINYDARVGRSQVVAVGGAAAGQPGFYCSVCECSLRDHVNWLDHINGKNHQKKLGMSMRVERSSVAAVKEKLTVAGANKKPRGAPVAEPTEDFDAKMARLEEEDEARKRDKAERRKQQKQNEADAAAAALAAGGEGLDPEMAALMGFNGFGGSAKT